MQANSDLVTKYQDMGRNFWKSLPSHIKIFNVLITVLSLIASFSNFASMLSLSPAK